MNTLTDMADSPYQRTLSYEFYSALNGCINSHKADYEETSNIDSTATDAIKNWSGITDIDADIVKTSTTTKVELFSKIFTNANDDVHIGRIAENYVKNQGYSIGTENGIVSCVNISKAAYKLWVLDNYRGTAMSIDNYGAPGILTAIGYASNSDKQTTIYSISKQPTLATFLKSNIYSATDPVRDDGLKYYMYKHYLLENGYCGAKEYDTTNSKALIVPKTEGSQVGTLVYRSVKATMFLDDDTGNIKDYNLKLTTTTNTTDKSISVSYDEKTVTCTDIASKLSEVTKRIKTNRQYQQFFASISKSTGIEAAVKDDTTTDQTDTKTSCAIGGVGWIVCPVSNFLANIADGAFHYLSGSFLEVKSQAFDTSNTTYDAWSAMRNIANVLFVIVFLAIIFSQMSGFGITNYGVKKMLPRLIVAAILVNTSYFICQIAIDISNIIGYSLDNMLKNFATSAIGSSGAVEDGSYFSSKVATVLGFTGTLALAALSITIPMIIAAVAALIMIVFLLVSRQAVVILLVVVAPIAFVAYLLPNTNSLFKQWKKIFLAMLMLFPIIALVFGASSMAATILNEAFNDSNNTTIGPVIVAAINVLPLFAVPIILKKSLNSVGNIGATINGLGAKLSGAATQQYQKSNAGQFMKYRQSQIEQNRTNAQAGIYKGRNPYRSAVSAINRGANTALKTGFGGKLLKNFAMSAESRGKSILDKEFEEQVSIAAASQKNMSYDSIKAIATGANAATEAERTAAIRVGLQKGAYSERKEIYKSIKTNDTDRIKTSATDGFFAQKDQQFFGAGMAGDIATGGIDEAKLIQNMAKSASKFSAETLVEDANASADIYKALQLNSGDIQEIFKSDNAEKTQQNIASYYKAASDLPQIAKNIPSSTVLQSKLNGEKSANIAKIAGLGVSSTTVDKS